MKITLHPLCSCFRSLDPDVTMRLIQFAHPVQRFLMPTWDLHLVILSSLQPLFMFETDNIIPLMTDTHSNISTAFGLHHEMLHHMTCMYLVWMSLQQRVFFKLSLIYCLNCVFLWRFSGLHKNHSGFEFPVLSTWIWINWNECFFLVLQLKLYISDSARIRVGLQQMFIQWDDAIRGIFWTH